MTPRGGRRVGRQPENQLGTICKSHISNFSFLAVIEAEIVNCPPEGGQWCPPGGVGGDPNYGEQLRSSYESHMPSFRTLSQEEAEIPISLYSTVAGYTPPAPPRGG